MSNQFNSIFKIPDRSLVAQRLTKAFFLRNFSLSTAEKKLLNNTIVAMEILGQVNLEKTNIPVVVTETDSYENILIITCSINNNQLEKYTDSCTQFIQKYIAHQVVLVIEDGDDFVINVAEKRINQVDNNKLVVDQQFNTSVISKLYKNEQTEAFFKALDFNTLDKTNLETTYKSYLQAVVQYQVANSTGSFNKRSQKRTEEDMANLLAIENIEVEITSLKSQLSKEKQLNNKVALNVAIQKKRQHIQRIKHQLTTI
ncbi:DUF4391 domain-containing protein [Cellulophaga sp. 20_2_10]|uniref:DUF4391 domain-containing protein n=1 Tax=Cellulophaga sp. 20_2_10 TaxID=2942476 RepID=UPI00201A49A9|nr:DUF4391 domain-containing protein [Cellulophaga sp. 20_2_10]MCL5246847.1 DUF4391 domain-containing protein [Cellulophaga sp. 20_2_10]